MKIGKFRQRLGGTGLDLSLKLSIQKAMTQLQQLKMEILEILIVSNCNNSSESHLRLSSNF